MIDSVPTSEFSLIGKHSINSDIEVFTDLSPVMTGKGAPDTEIYLTSNQAINSE